MQSHFDVNPEILDREDMNKAHFSMAPNEEENLIGRVRSLQGSHIWSRASVWI